MASVKIMLYQHKTYADGTHPITVQVIHGKQIKRKVIYWCKLSDWDEKNNKIKPRRPNAAYINALIVSQASDAEKELLGVVEGGRSINEVFSKSNNSSLEDVLKLETDRLREGMKMGAYDVLKGVQGQLGGFCNKISASKRYRRCLARNVFKLPDEFR